MKKAIEVQAPNVIPANAEKLTNVFLAGSIEMGTADEWQKRIIDELSDIPIRFLNPRRNDWDASWNEENNKDLLVEQIIWELTSLEISDMIVLYFDPKTKSPISLLEMGLHARGKKLIVLCPNGFWKKTNVDVTCEFYDIDQVDTFDELIKYLRNNL